MMDHNNQFADKLGTNGDAFYGALINAHDGLDISQSHALNARLVLMMANQIGDLDLIGSILSKARELNDG